MYNELKKGNKLLGFHFETLLQSKTDLDNFLLLF